MKICFLAGSLARGKTGVGDYTLLLAEACRSKGLECFPIGMNEPLGEDYEVNSESLRLPETMPWREREATASAWMEQIDPDWVSLQFVPYAFHPRGLFYTFLKVFPRIARNRLVHIMLHEIWIGEFPKAPWSHKLWGSLQKRWIKTLFRKTSPTVVNHSCAGAEIRLRKAGLHSEHLPIFGNIQPIAERNPSRLRKLLKHAIPELSPETRSQWWILGFFGSIHDDWQTETSLKPIISAAQQMEKKIAVISLGRLGKAERKWKEISEYRNHEVQWVRVGELEAKPLSECLQELDYGLTSTPWDLVGKSGAIAAMVEHGIPVFVSVEGGTPNAPLVISENYRNMIHRTDKSLHDALLTDLPQSPVVDGLDATAVRFIESLSRHQK